MVRGPGPVRWAGEWSGQGQLQHLIHDLSFRDLRPHIDREGRGQRPSFVQPHRRDVEQVARLQVRDEGTPRLGSRQQALFHCQENKQRAVAIGQSTADATNISPLLIPAWGSGRGWSREGEVGEVELYVLPAAL